jgi:hypothetical protein
MARVSCTQRASRLDLADEPTRKIPITGVGKEPSHSLRKQPVNDHREQDTQNWRIWLHTMIHVPGRPEPIRQGDCVDRHTEEQDRGAVLTHR